MAKITRTNILIPVKRSCHKNDHVQYGNSFRKKMGEFGGHNAHSTLNTDCESGVKKVRCDILTFPVFTIEM